MCGLFGIAGNGIVKDDLKVFYELGIVSQLRGTDSSGYFEVNSRHYRPHTTEKLLASAHDFTFFSWKHLESDQAKGDKKILNNLSANVIMGHVRKATVGDINGINAMPFSVEDIVFSHNGTILLKKYHEKSPELSDSYLFSRDVAARGLTPVLDEVRDHGSYAIVMYSRKTKKLYFTRNPDRTLWFAVNQKRNVLYWASERWMLSGVLDRNHCDINIIEEEKWKSSALYALTPGSVFEVDPEEIRPKKEIFKIVSRIFWWDKDTKKIVWNADQQKEVVTTPTKLSSQQEQIKNLPILSPVVLPSTTDVDKTVIPFDHPVVKKRPSDKPKVGKRVDFSKECGACGRSLSLLEQFEIRKKEISGYHASSSDTYYCECVGTGALKPSVNADPKKTNTIH